MILVSIFYHGAVEPFGYPEGITVVLCLPVDFTRLREPGAL